MRSKFLRYIQANPDLAHWFANGAPESSFIKHYKKYQKSENREPGKSTKENIYWSNSLFFKNHQKTLYETWKAGLLFSGQQFVQETHTEDKSKGWVTQTPEIQNAQFNPEISRQIIECEFLRPAHSPLPNLFNNSFSWVGYGSSIAASSRKVFKALAKEDHYDVVVIAPWLETGGAELVAMHHFNAANKLGLNACLVTTESPIVTERFKSLEVINLCHLFEDVGQDFLKAAQKIKNYVLKELLCYLKPKIVHVVHSYTAYELLKASVQDKKLDRFDFFISAFNSYFENTGEITGYFRDIPYLDRPNIHYLFDNSYFYKKLKELYKLDSNRTTTVFYPCLDKIQRRSPSRTLTHHILWASRLDAEKNPLIVMDIAKQNPDYMFHLYGRKVLNNLEIDWDNIPENVEYCGEFYSLDDIPLKQYDFFLYTSKFDGMPNILLEVSARGLPIISSDIGGVRDFLDEHNAYLHHNAEDAKGFSRLIRNAYKNIPNGHQKALNAQKKIKAERSVKAFVRDIKQLQAYGELI